MPIQEFTFKKQKNHTIWPVMIVMNLLATP